MTGNAEGSPVAIADGHDADLVVRQAVPGDHPAVASFTTDTWGDGDYVAQAFPAWLPEDGPTQRTLVAVDRRADPPAALPEGVDPGGWADDGAGDAGHGEDGGHGEDAGHGEDGGHGEDAGHGEDGGGDVETPDGRAVGVCQAVVCSEHEGWVQAMRVDPDYRGRGLSTALNDAAFRWLHERGCVVARNMVFSSNVGGLGGSRAAGFEPATEFRWAHVEPGRGSDCLDVDDATGGDDAPDANGDHRDDSGDLGADAAWAFWQASDARTHLRGLALDDDEGWALSELTREDLRVGADDGRLQVVGDDGVAGFSLRVRTADREGDDGGVDRRAEYGVAVWRDLAACRRLFDAVGRDAAGVGADRTRVLIPEGAEWVSDAAAARADLADEPDFVMAADLTRAPWNREA